MKKILILTDSLALARVGKGEDKHVLYEETWPELLKESLKNDTYDIQRFSMGHASVSDIEKQLKYWRLYRPDIVIFQIGLNDALPRVLHKHELEFCEKYKFIGTKIKIYVNKFPKFFRSMRKITYFNKEEFRVRVSKLHNFFQNAYFIEMIYHKQTEPSHLPSYYKKNIDAFNDVMSHINDIKIIRANEILNSRDDTFISDGFHLTAEGHKVIFNEVRDALFHEDIH